MDVDTLVRDPQLNRELSRLHERLQQPEHAVSDIVDDAGNQYIDLVMEGGGMLGIALVGYTWALEQMGIRFFGLGGTSAGSINALLLAAVDEPAAAKSPRLLQELGNMNFYDFVDGGTEVREVIEFALGKPRPLKTLRLLYKFLSVKERLAYDYGLNRGDSFLKWLSDLLSDCGIDKLSELDKRLACRPAGLRLRDQEPFAADGCPQGKLVIIAADITTETRVEFPRMAPLYWAQPERVNPARFARASMAIPFFFEPLRVLDIPRGEAAKANWRSMAGYAVDSDPTAMIPQTAMFVDGGIMSNFPIDAFHDVHKVPSMPTFGVKLQYDQRYKPPGKLPTRGDGRLKDLGPLAGAMFNSARHTLDYEFIKKHPDYRHLVQFIPCTYTDPMTDQLHGYNWLDFNMSEQHRAGLFRQGARKAIEFIEQFSAPVNRAGGAVKDGETPAYSSKWRFYQQLRKTLLETSEQ